jgi:hypothetical protein
MARFIFQRCYGLMVGHDVVAVEIWVQFPVVTCFCVFAIFACIRVVGGFCFSGKNVRDQGIVFPYGPPVRTQIWRLHRHQNEILIECS